MKTRAAFAPGTASPRETPSPPPAGWQGPQSYLAGSCGRIEKDTEPPQALPFLLEEAVAGPLAPAGLGAARLLCDASPWRRGEVPGGSAPGRRGAGRFTGPAGGPGLKVKRCVSSNMMDTLLSCICLVHAMSFPENCLIYIWGEEQKGPKRK